MSDLSIRIGTGYDVHRCVLTADTGRKMILCGTEIPGGIGIWGHSDADCAVHALIDAIFGALALGDIGRHFPDSDEKYRNISSISLLKEALSLADERGYSLSNCDLTIVLEKPKLAPYIARMRQNLAAACGVAIDAVSVKATTEEGLGVSGRDGGVAAHAVVLMGKNGA